MKILITLIFFSATWAISLAQVGINTTSPQASLDIVASNTTTPSIKDGLIVPRMHDFPVINPDLGQNAMMVFITGDGTATKGFYFWDNNNTSWEPVPGRDNSRMFLNPQYPDGLAEIEPITRSLGSGYTVPVGQNLYITNYFSNLGSTQLAINSNQIYFGANNIGAISAITNPIIAGEGDLVTSTAAAQGRINGFLVDAFVSPITATETYTVPSGKILVILSSVASGGNGDRSIIVDGILVYTGIGNSYTASLYNHSYFQPIFADAGDVITCTGAVINGYLLDK